MAIMLGSTPAIAQDNSAVPTPPHQPVHHPLPHHAQAHHAHGVTAKSAEHPATAAANSDGAGQSKAAMPPPSAGHSTTTAKAEPPAAAAAVPASPPPSHTAAAPSAKSATAPAETAPSANPKSPLNPAVAESFVGQAVYGRKGEKIGALSQVVTGPDGKVKSAVITWGGLFGYFQSSRTVDWAAADPVVKDGKLVLDKMSKDQVRNSEQPQAKNEQPQASR